MKSPWAELSDMTPAFEAEAASNGEFMSFYKMKTVARNHKATTSAST
jgi:hypothetical protein